MQRHQGVRDGGRFQHSDSMRPQHGVVQTKREWRELPMQRIGKPEDIAAACAYLASEEASYITGQTISTNGGRYMGSH